MDVDLLSRMVKELVLDHDEVALPGVGTFVTEVIPASFSDRGYTINPPYRRLSFRGKISENDTLLSDFYSKENGIDIETAGRILGDFLSEMKDVLKKKKVIVLPGLGRLRATRENTFFFIADEDLDIYPEGFGLNPVSLKTHVETEAEVSEAVESLKSIMDEPAPAAAEPAPAAAPENDNAEPVSKASVEITPAAEVPAESSQKVSPDEVNSDEVKRDLTLRKKKKNPYLITFIALVCAAVFLLALFVILSKTAPDFIDRLLYTKEELEIINYKL